MDQIELVLVELRDLPDAHAGAPDGCIFGCMRRQAVAQRAYLLSAKVIHIGLTHTPAFPDTACWSAEDDLDDLPETVRAIAARWSPPSARSASAPWACSKSGFDAAPRLRAGRADSLLNRQIDALLASARRLQRRW